MGCCGSSSASATRVLGLTECIQLVDYCSDLVAVQMAVDALAPVSAHTGGITSLGDEGGLHRVKKTPTVVLDLA